MTTSDGVGVCISIVGTELTSRCVSSRRSVGHTYTCRRDTDVFLSDTKLISRAIYMLSLIISLISADALGNTGNMHDK